ncbi:uncharacterized protein LOC118403406 [Branchiostoma floridae]|uniref:Uncharacterized protein LOC118403406 n=1 Tax=Branchiostoma floridae TaxID=7739 RepID=A0A9J7HGL1_BRAFL|nr:uncharacterized protein LOC118403406 [Branchiostoma floridae]
MLNNRTILTILVIGTFYTCTWAVVPDAWGAALPPEMAGALTRKQWVQDRRNTMGREVENPCALPSAVRPPACDWWLVHRYARSFEEPEVRQDRDSIGAQRSSLALGYLLGLPSRVPSRRATAQRPVYFRRGL